MAEFDDEEQDPDEIETGATDTTALEDTASPEEPPVISPQAVKVPTKTSPQSDTATPEEFQQWLKTQQPAGDTATREEFDKWLAGEQNKEIGVTGHLKAMGKQAMESVEGTQYGKILKGAADIATSLYHKFVNADDEWDPTKTGLYKAGQAIEERGLYGAAENALGPAGKTALGAAAWVIPPLAALKAARDFGIQAPTSPAEAQSPAGHVARDIADILPLVLMGPVSGALSGAAAMGAQGADTQREMALAKNATPSATDSSVLAGGAAGAFTGLTMVAFGKFMSSAERTAPGFYNWASRTALDAAKTAPGFVTMDAVGQFLNNAISKIYYDPEHPLYPEVSGLVKSGIVGAAFGAGHGAFKRFDPARPKPPDPALARTDPSATTAEQGNPPPPLGEPPKTAIGSAPAQPAPKKDPAVVGDPQNANERADPVSTNKEYYNKAKSKLYRTDTAAQATLAQRAAVQEAGQPDPLVSATLTEQLSGPVKAEPTAPAAPPPSSSDSTAAPQAAPPPVEPPQTPLGPIPGRSVQDVLRQQQEQADRFRQEQQDYPVERAPVPYVAGEAGVGTPDHRVVIDPAVPARVAGIDPVPALVKHETVEGAAERAGETYAGAHESKATPAEDAVVRQEAVQAGQDPNATLKEYDREMQAITRQTEKETGAGTPADLVTNVQGGEYPPKLAAVIARGRGAPLRPATATPGFVKGEGRVGEPTPHVPERLREVLPAKLEDVLERTRKPYPEHKTATREEFERWLASLPQSRAVTITRETPNVPARVPEREITAPVNRLHPETKAVLERLRNEGQHGTADALENFVGTEHEQRAVAAAKAELDTTAQVREAAQEVYDKAQETQKTERMQKARASGKRVYADKKEQAERELQVAESEKFIRGALAKGIFPEKFDPSKNAHVQELIKKVDALLDEADKTPVRLNTRSGKHVPVVRGKNNRIISAPNSRYKPGRAEGESDMEFFKHAAWPTAVGDLETLVSNKKFSERKQRAGALWERMKFWEKVAKEGYTEENLDHFLAIRGERRAEADLAKSHLKYSEQPFEPSGMIDTFHGSPHDIKDETFRREKVGTGEGAAAFGKGVAYTAEQRAVAETYRDPLSDDLFSPSAREHPVWGPKIKAAEKDVSTSYERWNKLEEANAERNKREAAYENYTFAENYKLSLANQIAKEFPHEGFIYKTRLHGEPDEFFDRDKPVGKQTPEIQRAVKEILPDAPLTEHLWDRPRAGVWEYKLKGDNYASLGKITRQVDGFHTLSDNRKGVYKTLEAAKTAIEDSVKLDNDQIFRNLTARDIEQTLGRDKFAAALEEKGVKGFQYLDQGSRDTGDGSHNYVLFKPEHASILEKNDKPHLPDRFSPTPHEVVITDWREGTGKETNIKVTALKSERLSDAVKNSGALDIPGIRGDMNKRLSNAAIIAAGDIPVVHLKPEDWKKTGRAPDEQAIFDPLQRHILVNTGLKTSPRTMMHEAEHAALDVKIQSGVGVKEIRAIMDEVTEHDPSIMMRHAYAFKNEREFMAESGAKGSLQNDLMAIPISKKLAGELEVPGWKGKLTNAWQGLLSAYRKMLGIRHEDVTALEAVWKVREDIQKAEVPLSSARKLADQRRQAALRSTTAADVSRFTPSAMADRVVDDSIRERIRAFASGPRTPRMTRLYDTDVLQRIGDRFWSERKNFVRDWFSAQRSAKSAAENYIREANPLMKDVADMLVRHKNDGLAESYQRLMREETFYQRFFDVGLDEQGFSIDPASRAWADPHHAANAAEMAAWPEDLHEMRAREYAYGDQVRREVQQMVQENRLTEYLGVTDPAMRQRILEYRETPADIAAVGGEEALDVIRQAENGVTGPYSIISREGKYAVTGRLKVNDSGGHTRAWDDPAEYPAREFATPEEANTHAAAQEGHTRVRGYRVAERTETRTEANGDVVSTVAGERDYTVTDVNGNTRTLQLTAEDPNTVPRWKAVTNNRYYDRLDTQYEANRRKADLEASGRLVPGSVFVTKNAYRPEVGPSVIGRHMMNLDNMLKGNKNFNALSEAQKAVVRDTLAQHYLELRGHTSVANSRLHRTYTAGAERLDRAADVAHSVVAGAYQRAALRYRPQMDKALEEGRNSIHEDPSKSLGRSQLMNEIERRDTEIRKMATLNASSMDAGMDRLMGWSYNVRLLTPSFTIRNLTQPWMYTLMVAGPKYGYGKAFREMSKAYRDIGTGKILGTGLKQTGRALFGKTEESDYHTMVADLRNRLTDPYDKETLDHALDQGAINKDQGFQIEHHAIRAEGVKLDIGKYPNEFRTRVENALGTTDKWLHYMEQLGRSMPAAAELTNRAVTVLTIARLERAAGTEKKLAFQRSVDMSDMTQFNYDKINKPGWQNHWALRPAVQFKQFGKATYTLFGSLAGKAIRGLEPGDRRYALAALGGLMASHAAVAGIMGLPTEPIRAALIGLQQMGYKGPDLDDFESGFRALTVDLTGSVNLAEALTNGLTRFLGFDTRQGLGVENMFILGSPQFGTERDMKKNFLAWLAAAAGGSLGSIVVDAAEGLRAIENGNYAEGLTKLPFPKMVTDAARVYRGLEGKPNAKGRQTMEPYTPGEAIARGIGFPVAKELEQGAYGRDWREGKQKETNERSKLMNAYVTAKTPEEKADARAAAIDAGIKYGDLQKAVTRAKSEEKRSVNGVVISKKDRGAAEDLARRYNLRNE